MIIDNIYVEDDIYTEKIKLIKKIKVKDVRNTNAVLYRELTSVSAVHYLAILALLICVRICLKTEPDNVRMYKCKITIRFRRISLGRVFLRFLLVI